MNEVKKLMVFLGTLLPYNLGNVTARRVLAEKLIDAGYLHKSQLEEVELKPLGEEEISRLPLPTEEEVFAFRDNPNNEFGNTTLELKTIAAYCIVFAKKVNQATIDANVKQCGGKVYRVKE